MLRVERTVFSAKSPMLYLHLLWILLSRPFDKKNYHYPIRQAFSTKSLDEMAFSLSQRVKFVAAIPLSRSIQYTKLWLQNYQNRLTEYNFH